jgi:outer membrane receptor protein involved in Fe transport
LNLESGLPLPGSPCASTQANCASESIFGIPLLDQQYLFEEQIITHDKQLAAFSEANFHLTSRLELTAGLRVARTELDSLDTYNGPLSGGAGQAYGKHLQTPKTPKYVLSYQITPANLVYASMADGFRIGGVNRQVANNPVCSPDLAALGLSAAPTTYNSDRTRSYEIGTKNQMAKFSLAASVYQIDWSDIIQPVDLVSCGLNFTTNLGKAVSQGFDIDAQWVPSSQLSLTLLLSYDNAKFTKTIRLPDATSNTVTSGWTLGQTPWTVVASGEFKFAGPFAWNSYLRTDVQYRSRNGGLTAITDPQSAAYDPVLRPNPSTIDVRLRTGVRVATWDVSLFVNNATNSHPILDLQDDTRGGYIRYATATRPLTVGLTAEARFGVERQH